jgi:site-specific recombinase XerD
MVARRLESFCRRVTRMRPMRSSPRCAGSDPSGYVQPLTRNGFLQMIKSAAGRARIAKRVHSHHVAHGFATGAVTPSDASDTARRGWT